MDFPAHGLRGRIASLPSVTAVRIYQGGYLDLSGRRVWIIAHSPAVGDMIPPKPDRQRQPGQRHSTAASRRLDHRLSATRRCAAHKARGPSHAADPGRPKKLRSRRDHDQPGMEWRRDRAEYPRLSPCVDERRSERSGSRRPSIEGAMRSWLSEEITRALGPNTGLQVQTSAQRAAAADELARQGLSRLSQVALLLVIVSALSMAAAMGAAIWQRRRTLASLRIPELPARPAALGAPTESGLVLGVSCLVGAIVGISGHLLADRYLLLATGFPISLSSQAPRAFDVLLLVLVAALAVLTIPGYLVSKTSPAMALDAP